MSTFRFREFITGHLHPTLTLRIQRPQPYYMLRPGRFNISQFHAFVPYHLTVTSSSIYQANNNMPISLSSKSYDQLPLVEDADEDGPIMEKPSSMRPSSHRLRRVWEDCLAAPKALIITGTLVTLTMFIIIITSFTSHTPGSFVKVLSPSQKNTPRPDFVDPYGGPIELAGTFRCGSYPSEADHHGCIFDIMNYGWTGSECYYEDLAEEALSKGPWKWYLDPEGTVELPQDSSVLGRAVEIWTELGYHLEHCKYTQRILARAENDDDTLVPQELAQRNHTKHCAGLIDTNTKSPLLVNTWVRTLYNPCVRLSDLR